jgi:hypothetical protein
MMIHGGVDDSEVAFRDTYVLAGINCLLHSSLQQQSLVPELKLSPESYDFRSKSPD